MHVGLTLGRSDVTAHASHQRGSCAPRPRPGPEAPSGSGKARGGIGGEGSVYARSPVRGSKGARRARRGGQAGIAVAIDGMEGRRPQRCGALERAPLPWVEAQVRLPLHPGPIPNGGHRSGRLLFLSGKRKEACRGHGCKGKLESQ